MGELNSDIKMKGYRVAVHSSGRGQRSKRHDGTQLFSYSSVQLDNKLRALSDAPMSAISTKHGRCRLISK
jgi:hypothetical protein